MLVAAELQSACTLFKRLLKKKSYKIRILDTSFRSFVLIVIESLPQDALEIKPATTTWPTLINNILHLVDKQRFYDLSQFTQPHQMAISYYRLIIWLPKYANNKQLSNK